jgi:hypothetical protein
MTDEEIRQAGFNFIPPQRFLASPFQIPENQEEPVVDQGIVATNAFAGSGKDGFNVYNPDPTKIKKYRPNYDFRKFQDYNPELSDLQNQKIMQNMPNFKGYDYYNAPEPTGLGKLVQLAGGLMPGRGVGSFIGDFLPVNRRTILENELAGQGVLIDDIGRIVKGKGDYNTAENVMAGYTSNVSQKSIDKRQGNILDTLKNKYKMSKEDIDAVKAGAYKGPIETDLIKRYSALEEFGNTLKLTNQLTDDIYDFEKEEKEKKKKDNILFKLFGKKDKQGKQDITTSSGDGDSGGAVTTTDTSATSQGDGGDPNITGGWSPGSGTQGTTQTGDFSYEDFAKGGRVGFNTGGHSRFEVGSGYYGETPIKSVSGEGGGDNQNKTIINTDNNKVVDTSNLLSQNPEISFNLSDPKNLALINARLYNQNILDNDDINLEGTLSNSLGPIDFTNYFTDEGLKNINVSTDALGGLFTANVDPDLQLQNISYERNIGPGNLRFTGDRDNQFLSYGITYKNGGLASLL